MEDTTEKIVLSFEEQVKEKFGVSSLDELIPLIEKPAEQIIEKIEVFVPQESEFSLMDKYKKETDFTQAEVRAMFREEGAWEAVEKAYTPVEDLSLLAKENVKDFWTRFYINEEKLSISRAIEKAELKELEDDNAETQRDLRIAISKLKTTEEKMFERFSTVKVEEKQEEIKPIAYSPEDKNVYIEALGKASFINETLKGLGVDIEYNFKSPENTEMINNLLNLSQQYNAQLFSDGVNEKGEPVKDMIMLGIYENELLRHNFPKIVEKLLEFSGAKTTEKIKDDLGQSVVSKGKEGGEKRMTQEEAERLQIIENQKNAELARLQVIN